MSDEERKLFLSKLYQAREMLTDSYIQLRKSGLPTDDVLLAPIAKWLDTNFDIDAEIMYKGYAWSESNTPKV
jgi:hypothetical protein